MESPKNILEKAIQKAIDGGFLAPDWVQGPQHYTQAILGMGGVETVIFNHDFAKALWGARWDEDRGCKVHASVHSPDSMGDDYQDPWEYHLQQMVIADDPIKYLGENL